MSANRAWLRIARRELAGGLGGFWIYLACLALGAWAIAAAGSVTASFARGLEIQSRLLLGGDAAVTISQRQATDAERTWLEERGKVAEAAQVDLMARKGDKLRQIDVRGIDAAFPLMGSFGFNPGAPPLHDILAKRDGVWGIAASESLLTELGVKIGDQLALGDFEVEVRAELTSEPDRIGKPGAFEPRVIISLDALKETGQLSPGRLFRTAYRL
jgi:putative ABC transport system permease protein